MQAFPQLIKADSKTAKLLLPAAVAMVILLGSANQLLGQAQPLITEIGFPSYTDDYTGSFNTSAGVAVADFNGDGISDIAMVNSAVERGNISVFLGNGDGTFKTPVIYFSGVSGAFAGSIIAADFNGDGKVDLCVADGPGGNIWVFFGNGDGTFQSPISSSILGIGASPANSVSIAAADFSGDGKLDVLVSAIVSEGQGRNGEVLLLVGNGAGTFIPANSSNPVEGGAANFGQVVAADFNGDGKPDFALVAQDSVTVALGNGAGVFTFSSSGYFPLAGQSQYGPSSIVVADFNGDGIPDLAIGLCDASFYDVNGNYVNASSVQVFLGKGDGSFMNPMVTTQMGWVSGPSLNVGAMGAADFTGDGHIDLFVGASESVGTTGYTHFLLPGNGDGTFQVPIPVGASSIEDLAQGVAVADLNRDGKPDVVLAADVNNNNQLVSILNTSGTVGAAIDPTAFNFGVQVVGAAAQTTTITIGNPGTSAMEFSGLAVSDTADFSVTTSCGNTVAPAGGCTITVTFNPETTGEKTASVTFNTSDPLALTGQISVTGNATAPVVSASPAEVQFSYQKVGTTSPAQTLQITNSGVGALTPVISIQGDFQQTNNCPASLAQGASCTASITFSPLVAGSEAGRLLVASNAIPSQSAVALTGIGFVIGPVISVSPTSYNFGSQYVGTSSAPSVVTVENNGDAPFTIASVAATSGFVPLSTCGNSVQPAFSCAIGIFFAPASTGSQTGALTITDNLSSSPQTVALTGNGTAITVGASSDSSTAQTLSSGTAAYKMSIVPVAGFSGTVNFSCVGLAAGYNCALSQSSTALNGSTAASVTVTVTASTTAAGLQGAPTSGTLGRFALACPIALIFLGAGIYPKWRRRFLAIGLLAVAASFTTSCTSNASVTNSSNQTYVFFLQSQPTSGVTIETPLTLTVSNQ